jgi:mannitol 2-dehydrogenase
MRISNSTLKVLPSGVRRPPYDREGLRQGIMHMSLGGFHRAHAAVYLDDLMSEHDALDWAICGVGLLPGDSRMRDALVPQDCLYTVRERSHGEERARVVGSITECIWAPEDPEKVFARMCEPGIRIVTLTVTEKGYCFNQGTGVFEPQREDVQHDLQDPGHPRTVLGYLAEGLRRRRAAGLKPWTVLSCDNIQENGNVAKRMLLDFCRLRDPTLAAWIETNVAFPNCMVDRITPVTTDVDRASLLSRYGIEDQWPVVCEPFRQWVIEDHFPAGRPGWEKMGVQMVSDVRPYEMMKIRLLNAGHFVLGYLGYLAGHEYVHDTIEDPDFRVFVRRIMDEEVTPLLTPPRGVDLGAYKDQLIQRFGNADIKDTLIRICQDGSSKAPKFVLPSIRERLSRGEPARLLILAIAGWLRYLAGFDEKSRAITVDDPISGTLVSHAKRGGSDPSAILELIEVFGTDLPLNEPFRNELGRALKLVYEKGSACAVSQALRQ